MKLKKNEVVSEVVIHPETGEELTRAVYPKTICYKNESKTIDMPGWYTRGGKDAIFTAEDLCVYNKAMRELKAKINQDNNILSSEQIRKIRRKLKLTQAEAGRLIGGGPRAFQKYETGEVYPSQAASNLLRLLDKDPDRLKELNI